MMQDGRRNRCISRRFCSKKEEAEVVVMEEVKEDAVVQEEVEEEDGEKEQGALLLEVEVKGCKSVWNLIKMLN